MVTMSRETADFMLIMMAIGTGALGVLFGMTLAAVLKRWQR